jgi:hypothetical protein
MQPTAELGFIRVKSRARPGLRRVSSLRCRLRRRSVWLASREGCVELGPVPLNVRYVGRVYVDVSCGEALLLNWIAGLGTSNDVVNLPTLPLENRV